MKDGYSPLHSVAWSLALGLGEPQKSGSRSLRAQTLDVASYTPGTNPQPEFLSPGCPPLRSFLPELSDFPCPSWTLDPVNIDSSDFFKGGSRPFSGKLAGKSDSSDGDRGEGQEKVGYLAPGRALRREI